MRIKEIQESFRKKYRNKDLYLLFDRNDSKSTEDRVRKSKTYCRMVIKNKTGDKIKFINGGAIAEISKVKFMDNNEYEIMYIGETSYRLVPLNVLKISSKEQTIKLDFAGTRGDGVPVDLWRFCDIACLFGKYASDGSLVSDVLKREEDCQLLSERQIIRVEKFLNETIHNGLKEKIKVEKEERFEREQRQIEKNKKQKLEKMLDDERDF